MVYIDLLVLENLVYNYVTLYGTSILLSRITNFRKIFFSSAIGTISLICLFIDTTKQLNFIISIIFSIIMSLISFSYKNIIFTIKNIIYIYTTSIFIAGFIYLLNTNIFPTINSNILNIVILILLAPIITIVYIKSIHNIKTNHSDYYKVDIYIDDNEKITVNGFLDTGNKLIDPYKGRPIIIISESIMKTENKKILLVPYNTVSGNGLLKCVIPKKIYIYNVGYRNKLLIGITDEINIEGADCILNQKLLERI